MLNRVTLIGHLGADPEIRHTQDGRKIANFRMATSEQWKDKDTGERRDRAEWHSIVVFNEQLADVAAKYLKKGSKVYIEGMLQTRDWEDKEGIKRWTTEVVLKTYAGTIKMLDPSGSGRPPASDNPDAYGQGDSYDTRRSASNGGTTLPPKTGGGGRHELDDDIPFAPEFR
jgi:single-strand DNA-binding protein